MKDFLKRYEPVIVFYFLACLFSWPFLFWRDVHPTSWNELEIHLVLKISLVMWGPGLSAILCSLLYQNRIKKTIGLFGSSILKSLLFWGIPMGIFLVLNYVKGQSDFSSLAVYSVGSLLFTLGEEMGWRGFLQDQLNHLPKWKRYLLIGILWEAWHFTTRTLSGSIIARIMRPILFVIPNTVLSWILGESVNRTKSLIVAVTFHSWFNLIFEFPNPTTYIALGVSIPFWVFMVLKWDKIRL